MGEERFVSLEEEPKSLRPAHTLHAGRSPCTKILFYVVAHFVTSHRWRYSVGRKE